MGALELEGRGRRPQGRGCFLLAVAGATSLVTLLLAVPITILAVLALVPQEQGGLVSGSNRPWRLPLAEASACRGQAGWLASLSGHALEHAWPFVLLTCFPAFCHTLCPHIPKPLLGCVSFLPASSQGHVSLALPS